MVAAMDWRRTCSAGSRRRTRPPRCARCCGALRVATGGDGKDYHRVDLEAVEITVQRDFFGYFSESMSVFDEAYRQAHHRLLAAS